MSVGDDRSTARPLTEPEAFGFFERGLAGARDVLAAVSGGPDSMALLALLARWPRRPKLLSATVDHGLRAASAGEARIVDAFAAALGVAHATLAWEGAKPSAGLQEAARAARYELLATHARQHGCTHIVTAHHADDQAETVLLRLAAGSGVGGLAAIRPTLRMGDLTLVRPFLDVPKARLVAFCGEQGLPSVDDASNRDERFARARLRKLTELLAREGLTRPRLTRLAARAARADEALERAADLAMDGLSAPVPGEVVRVAWSGVMPLPEEIRLRVLSRLLRLSGFAGDHVRLDRLELLLAAVDSACLSGTPLRRSIADRTVSLASTGELVVAAAPSRRRGTARHAS